MPIVSIVVLMVGLPLINFQRSSIGWSGHQKLTLLLDSPVVLADLIPLPTLKVPFSSSPIIDLTLFYCASIPASSKLTVTCKDGFGKQTGTSTFDLGWRAYPNKIYNVQDLWLTNALIRIDSDLDANAMYERGSATSMRAYYAIASDRAYLVKVENPQGELIPNEYRAENWIVGPKDEYLRWQADLASADPSRQLAALVWLGGTHEKLGKENPFKPSRNTVQHAQAFANAGKNLTVIERVKELSADTNPWIRSQATWTYNRLLKFNRMDEKT